MHLNYTTLQVRILFTLNLSEIYCDSVSGNAKSKVRVRVISLLVCDAAYFGRKTLTVLSAVHLCF